MDPSLPAFELWGAEHRWTLVAVVAVWLAVIFLGRRASAEVAWRGAKVLAIVLILYRLVEAWGWHEIGGYAWIDLLPLHICGILYLISAYTLWTGSQRSYELTYYWSFAGTSHSLITPDLAHGFPTFHFLAFFLSHSLILLAALYATFVLGMSPGKGSVLRAFLGINLFALVVALANLALGTNYMFLMAKPEAASLMDYLGPWPWYILALEVLALASFGLWYLPFWLASRRRQAVSGRASRPGS